MLSDDYTCLTFWPPRGPRAKGRSLKKDDVSPFLRAARGPCTHGKPTTAAREAPEGVSTKMLRHTSAQAALNEGEHTDTTQAAA